MADKATLQLVADHMRFHEDLQMIGPEELGQILGRSTKTIKCDVTRRPNTLPPRFVVPGTRLLRWRIVDVRNWVEEAVTRERAEREIERRRTAKSAMGLQTRTRPPR
jgi:predicted DNA-binding transcriptional regulator AlpA